MNDDNSYRDRMSLRAATDVIDMTIWVLRCKECGNTRRLDLGFNLFEFQQLYLYCPVCKRNTFHSIEGPIEKSD